MKVSPVTRYKAPDFPSRAILDAHPELLRLVPRRWRSHPLVLAALGTACLITLARWGQAADEQQPASRVAPIFQHGEGRGAFGCVAVSPPIFLSEEEARTVIIEEFKHNGYQLHGNVSFTQDGETLKGIDVPVTSLYSNGPQKPALTKERSIVIDGIDAKRKIAFEYVSRTDFIDWLAKEGKMSTVEDYDLLSAAQTLREGLVKAKPEEAYAVFYDPMIGVSEGIEIKKDGTIDRDTTDKNVKMIAKYALRLQVRDFIKWMKAQGVI